MARAANVSREFIHSKEELVRRVRDAAADQKVPTTAAGTAAARVAAERGFRAERATLLSATERQKRKIREQNAQIEALQEQRRRWLGSQLSPAISEEELVALRIANDRLTGEVVRLKRDNDELRRQTRILQGDLEASRLAHEETIRELTPAGSDVIPISEHRRDIELRATDDVIALGSASRTLSPDGEGIS
ncbi:MAG: hypothetical protein ACTHMF_19595 [Leifsonia sp.]|uniref:hypothetical protein n=1 Tax=Leifsonia sp. TaxID=1870902 RepID=UPI003F7D3659